MNEKLLTVRDLAERWQKTELTIRRYVADGILTPCKGVPGTMFAPAYIAKLEGVELERVSPLEKRRLETERDMYKKKYEDMKAIITNVLIEVSKVIKIPKENELDNINVWR